MKELSGRQAEVFEFIRQTIATTGSAPTLHEIRKHLGYQSLGSVSNIVETLKHKGILDGDRFKYRGIRIRHPRLEQRIEAMEPICVPLLDSAPKQTPLLSLENIVRHLSFDKKFIGERKVFCVQVSKDSVKGIHQGDYLLVSGGVKSKPGDLAVYLDGGQIVFSRKPGSYGKEYLGKVIGLFRPMTHMPGE